MDGVKLFVMLGYGEDFGLGVRSLDFKTEGLQAKNAVEVVRLIKGYNNFSGEKVAEAILAIGELWKSDHQQVTFEFGRESSPVLYISFPYWLENDKKMDTDIRNSMIEKSKELLTPTLPDELDYDGFRLRVWWD